MPGSRIYPASNSSELILAKSLGHTNIRCILLDIEGTTTPVEFVYDVLFPYARRNARDFIKRNLPVGKICDDIALLQQEHANDLQQKLDPPSWQDATADSQGESIVAYIHWLMDRDRKSTALKSLQGKIWEAGYLSGELRGEVYEDVATAFARWWQQNKRITIFSSGSVFAQKLLFGNSTAGDLTGFIEKYFDTTVGPKMQADSYRRIATESHTSAPEILFISDVTAELDAAQRAGMWTALCVRPGRPQPDSSGHPVIHTFAVVFP